MQLLPYHIFLLLYYGLLDGFDIQRSKQFCDSLWFKWKHISKEDADSSADFSLSIASELYEEPTCDNITYVLCMLVCFNYRMYVSFCQENFIKNGA